MIATAIFFLAVAVSIGLNQIADAIRDSMSTEEDECENEDEQNKPDEQ